MSFEISEELIERHNRRLKPALDRGWAGFERELKRRGTNPQRLFLAARPFVVAVPSWGLAAGGTRFGRFPFPGEPRHLYEKLDDAATLHRLTRQNPTVSLHIPWDQTGNPAALRAYARQLGLSFDAMNSNTFQDQPGQKLSYKFGSLCHTDPAVRGQAVAHNLEVIEIGKKLGSRALSVWIGDGGNYPGQVHFRRAFDRYLESLEQIYAGLPRGWRLYLEHKPYEPAFYFTVNADWGASYLAASALGPKALCLVDLGHHLPGTNVEAVVARLIRQKKLGGFHFNDAQYGDDDLSAGSINPYRLFLVMNELQDAAQDPAVKNFHPAFLLDQSMNLKDPIEDLIQSTEALFRAFSKALLVNRPALHRCQEKNDPVMAEQILKQAFETDVTPLVQRVRFSNGGAIDPLALFRQSGYRPAKIKERG